MAEMISMIATNRIQRMTQNVKCLDATPFLFPHLDCLEALLWQNVHPWASHHRVTTEENRHRKRTSLSSTRLRKNPRLKAGSEGKIGADCPQLPPRLDAGAEARVIWVKLQLGKISRQIHIGSLSTLR